MNFNHLAKIVRKHGEALSVLHDTWKIGVAMIALANDIEKEIEKIDKQEEQNHIECLRDSQESF